LAFSWATAAGIADGRVGLGSHWQWAGWGSAGARANPFLGSGQARFLGGLGTTRQNVPGQRGAAFLRPRIGDSSWVLARTLRQRLLEGIAVAKRRARREHHVRKKSFGKRPSGGPFLRRSDTARLESRGARKTRMGLQDTDMKRQRDTFSRQSLRAGRRSLAGSGRHGTLVDRARAIGVR